MTMSAHLMSESSVKSNKQSKIFTGADSEYSVEEDLNAVTGNLIINIGPEPSKTIFYQK